MLVLCILVQAITAAFRPRLSGNYTHAATDSLQCLSSSTPERDHHRQDQPPRLLTLAASRADRDAIGACRGRVP